MGNISRTFSSVRSSTAFITFTIAYAVFTDQFLFAAIVPVAPFALRQRLHIPPDRVQYWIAILLGVFGIACFITSAPWGWYSDRSTSRRTPFLIGLFILLGATLILWFAPNLPAHIVGRALQGFASTIVWTTGLAVLVDAVSHDRIGEYMGYIGIAVNAGTLIAPLLGGVAFAKAGYNAVFGLITAIVAIDILLRLAMKEKLPEPVFVMTYDNSSLEAIVSRKEIETVSIASIETITAATKMPTLLRLLRSSRFLATLWGTLVLASTFAGFQTVLPLTVNDIFGWNSIGGGLIFLPLTAPALLGPVVGKLTDRFGGRWFATSGFLLMCVSLVLLRLVDHNGTSQKALLCVLLVLIGCCMTLTLEPLLAEITHGAVNLDAEVGVDAMTTSAHGQAYALFNMAWAGGNTIGPLWGGLITQHAGWKTMTWSLGLLAGVSALPVALLCGGWLFARRK